MYSVSDYFLQNIDKNFHHIRGTVSIKTDDGTVSIPFSDKNIKSDSFSISSQCVSGNAFEIGAVCSKELNMTIILPEIAEYALMGAVVSAEFSLETTAENTEWIPLGKFYITRPKKYRDYTEITACDAVGLLDLNDDAENPAAKQLSSSMQPYDILVKLCSYSGFETGNSKAEIEAMPNGTLSAYVPDDTEISSTRDMFSYLAAFLAGFVTTDRTGRIIIKQHGKFTEPVTTLECSMIKADTTAVSDFKMILCGAVVWFDEGQSWSKVWYPDVEGKPNSTIIDMTDNPFMTGCYLLNSMNLEAMFTPLGNIAEQCINVQWIPFECEYYGNPAIDAGDCITIQNYDGTSVISVVSHSTFSFRNTQKIKCSGDDSRLVTGVRTENKRMYEIMEKKINNAKGKNVTQSEFDQLEADGKLIEGQTYYITGD